MGSRGPLRGPGAEPRRGSRGQRPRKFLGFSICKRPRKALLEIFFSLNQPTSAWYRNVSIKWHSSLCRVNFRPLGTAPNPKLSMFEHYLKIINYFEKMIWLSWSKLSEKVQKWHSNFARSSVSWVIDWTMQNIFCILSVTLYRPSLFQKGVYGGICPLRSYENFAMFKPNLRELMHTFR